MEKGKKDFGGKAPDCSALSEPDVIGQDATGTCTSMLMLSGTLACIHPQQQAVPAPEVGASTNLGAFMEKAGCYVRQWTECGAYVRRMRAHMYVWSIDVLRTSCGSLSMHATNSLSMWVCM